MWFRILEKIVNFILNIYYIAYLTINIKEISSAIISAVIVISSTDFLTSLSDILREDMLIIMSSR